MLRFTLAELEQNAARIFALAECGEPVCVTREGKDFLRVVPMEGPFAEGSTEPA